VSALSDSDSTALPLCKAVIAMATELGMTVVAEGVETAQQHHILQLAGCHQGQGYWYARPMPAAELEAWVRQRQTRPVDWPGFYTGLPPAPQHSQ
jgi:EAL domain-containing protein (putative c-di-GMP-specific phosphodiesterase class I)